MLNGNANENGFKNNRSNQQKNKLHVQHTSSLAVKYFIKYYGAHISF